MPQHMRELRLQLGLRQSDVARVARIPNHQIRKWERGLALPPPPAIASLAKIFGVDAVGLGNAQRSYMVSVEAGEGYTTAANKSSSVKHSTGIVPDDRLRVLDLFCGAGGLSFGLELTGKFITVAGIDLLPDRIATFKTNHPHATGIVADIRKFPIQELKSISGHVDMVVGGPPCQGFSSIRPFRTLTERDKRNTLIEHFLIAIATIKPKWFVFENVVGILTHHKGLLLRTLLEGFEACGYHSSWRVMNSALYGVPQNRERLLIVGNRNGTDFVWPAPTHQHYHKSMAGSRQEVIRTDPIFSQHLPPAVTVNNAIGDLPPLRAGESSGQYHVAPLNSYQDWVRKGSDTLTLHTATRHSDQMLRIIKHSGPNISAIPKHLITSGFSTCYSRLNGNDPSTTLTVNFVHPASNRCIHPLQDRALTPREGARIQSFPDSYKFHGNRAQIVKQIGNAVPPLLARAIGEGILHTELRGVRANGDVRYSTPQIETALQTV